MRTVRKSFVAVVTLVLALALAAPSSAGKKGREVLEPPYKAGPSGGDEFNHIESDPDAGSVRVIRLFPGFSPVVGCAPEPAAGWAMLVARHKVTSAVHKVTVNFDAQLEFYAWVTAALRDEKGRWLGVEKMQGPHVGGAKLVVRPHHNVPIGSTMTVEFGVQLGDACPQLGVASATFPSIVVE
jgi:hypothetical protein